MDNNGQTPIYYAIKFGRFEMVEYLIQKGANLKNEDKRGQSPSHFAKKHNKLQILDLILQNGGVQINEGKKHKATAALAAKKAQQEAALPKQKTNERKIPRRYLLTTLREGGYYEPLTDAEFEKFKQENPDLAAYFEQTEDAQDVTPIEQLKVPEVPESAPIYDQWEKAAQRLMMTLSRNQFAWIFAEPVNAEKLNIQDYYTVVKEPMDFGTIKTKLKEHKYDRIEQFIRDMELVFYNCRLYNGEQTEVGKMGKSVHEEFNRLREQLFLSFYQ